MTRRCWLFHKWGPWVRHLISFRRRECQRCPTTMIRHPLTGVTFIQERPD